MNKNIQIPVLGQQASQPKKNEHVVINRCGNIIKRGSIEDCRDFLRCNSQFTGFAIV